MKTLMLLILAATVLSTLFITRNSIAAYMQRTGLVVLGAATTRDMHIDTVLTEMALGYRPEGLIADMIFPTVRVSKQSDLYQVFSRADRLRIENATRAPGTAARLITEDIGSNTYYAKNYALAKFVTVEDKANADPMLLAELLNGATTYLLDKLALGWELRVANMVNSGNNVGSFSNVASAWNGAGNPLANVNTALDNVRYANGKKANRVVFGPRAWDSFRRDSTVRGLIYGSNNGGGYVNEAQVAKLLDIEQVFVGGAFQNTAQEGIAESLSAVWRDNVLVYYAPSSPNRETPSFGYNFRWAAPGLANMQIERHPYDSIHKGERIEAGYYQDEKITGASYGFLIQAVNSSQV